MCYSYNIRINPPLTITEEQALEGLAILEEAFSELSRGKGSKFQVPSSKLKKGSKFQVPSSKLEDGLTFHKPGTGNSEPRTAKQNLEPGTRNLQL
jgi:hypothetical protein